jgi:hypothetical protein
MFPGHWPSRRLRLESPHLLSPHSLANRPFRLRRIRRLNHARPWLGRKFSPIPFLTPSGVSCQRLIPKTGDMFRYGPPVSPFLANWAPGTARFHSYLIILAARFFWDFWPRWHEVFFVFGQARGDGVIWNGMPPKTLVIPAFAGMTVRGRPRVLQMTPVLRPAVHPPALTVVVYCSPGGLCRD